MKLGKLDFDDVKQHSELVAVVTKEAIEKSDLDDVLVSEIDASLADTAVFCEAYDIGLDVSANCVVVEAKRADKTWYAACMILATNRADINGVVRRQLDARKISFAPMDTATSLTKMEYGGITPIGLPDDWQLIVDLLALSIEEVEKRLADKDVIFVVGGDTDYLMSVYQKTGFDKLLPKLLETKVYVGSSAVSMVVGKRINAAAYRLIYGGDSKWNVDQYVGLVDLSVMPYLDSPHFPNRKESLLEAVGSFEGRVYGLRDDSAVVIDGDDVSTVGSEPIFIEKGKLVSG